MSLEERVSADIETIKLDIKDLLRINVNHYRMRGTRWM